MQCYKTCRRQGIGVILSAVLVVWLFSAAAGAESPVPKAPSTLVKGETLFNTHCASCHGVGGRGTAKGPSFLDKIYAPDHHADVAFYRAPDLGVRAHHWQFGDMPKIPGVSRQDLDQIIPYIRWLQKDAKIF
jgi:mono/diheme cytochrome c family protein